MSVILQLQIKFGRVSTPCTCERGLSLFSAIDWLNWMSKTRTSISSTPSTEITNGEKCFRWSLQSLRCLYFLIIFNQSRSAAIGSYVYESASELPSLTSMMDLTFQYHKPRIITSPHIYFYLSLTWHISFSDLVRPWWIRGLACTDAEMKACKAR